MGLNEYLIAGAFILIALDIFVATDIPTHIGYIIFTIVISKELPFHFMYKVLLGIVIWFTLVTFHYIIWKRFVVKMVNRFIAPEKLKSGLDSLTNQTGIIRIIDGKSFVKIQEELYTFHSSQCFLNGEKVIIIGNSDNVLHIQKQSSVGGV